MDLADKIARDIFAQVPELKLADASTQRKVGLAAVAAIDRHMLNAETAGPTGLQARCLKFIRTFTAERGFAPSFEEIKVALGRRAKSEVHRLVHDLAARGCVEFVPHRKRGVSLTRLGIRTSDLARKEAA